MVVFRPDKSNQLYSKQILHPDEKTYFVEGREQIILMIDKIKIALAICYESLQQEHFDHANKIGADIYLASVAKSQAGIEKAFGHFPKIALKFSTPTLMVNSIGHCYNFESAGQSSIWNENGNIIGQLENKNEGILIYDSALDKMKPAESTRDNTNIKHSYFRASKRFYARKDRRIFGSGFLGKTR